MRVAPSLLLLTTALLSMFASCGRKSRDAPEQSSVALPPPPVVSKPQADLPAAPGTEQPAPQPQPPTPAPSPSAEAATTAATGAATTAALTSTEPVGTSTYTEPSAQQYEAHWTPVVIEAGGYNSCVTKNGHIDPSGQAMDPLFTTLYDSLARASGVTPVYIVACYTPDVSRFYLRTSLNPEATAVSYHQDLTGVLSELLPKINHPVLYGLGHSYGAWMLMRTFLAPQLQPLQARLGGLTTLDAISKIECSTNNFPFDFLVGILISKGCQHAPSDLGPGANQALGARLGYWLNVFEIDSSFLHSSAIDGASRNILQHYPGRGASAHNDLLSDMALRQELGQQWSSAAGAPL